jgi:hypothetical protein
MFSSVVGCQGLEAKAFVSSVGDLLLTPTYERFYLDGFALGCTLAGGYLGRRLFSMEQATKVAAGE